MSLKLRLNLMITSLLLLIMLTGAFMTIRNARDDVRAEVESTAGLALYLLDKEIIYYTSLPQNGDGQLPFQLESLGQIRHLHIEFYDMKGRLRDSNQQKKSAVSANGPPGWFLSVMSAISPQWTKTHRPIFFGGRMVGELVITPDPSYEIAEVWNDTQGQLLLGFIFFAAVNIMVYWAVGRAMRPVDHIVMALSELEQGHLDARLPLFKLPELARVSHKFNGMAQALQQSIQQNQKLSQQLIQLQEEERKSLARDLHDEIGQSLAAIHADASTIVQSDSANHTAHSSALAIINVVHNVMDMVHRMLERLRPDTLDQLGLHAALNELIVKWRHRNGGTTCSLQVTGLPWVMDETVTVAAYRMVQECLTNIARHAQAQRVSISVWGEERMLVAVVEDDGRGLHPDSSVQGFGLAGMRERAQGLGGEWELESAPGAGTRITVRLPLSAGESI